MGDVQNMTFHVKVFNYKKKKQPSVQHPHNKAADRQRAHSTSLSRAAGAQDW